MGNTYLYWAIAVYGVCDHHERILDTKHTVLSQLDGTQSTMRTLDYDNGHTTSLSGEEVSHTVHNRYSMLLIVDLID